MQQSMIAGLAMSTGSAVVAALANCMRGRAGIRLARRVLQLLACACLSTGLGAQTDDSAGAALAASAEVAVGVYVQDLLQAMAEARPLYDSDREAYFSAVDAALTGFVDFREVARGVMAKYSTGPDGATAEQLDRFTRVFRSSLLEFYGGALAGVGAADFEFVSTGMEERNTENTTNVRMLLSAEGGNRFEVQYTMFLDGAGVWKLKNLYIEGVNLRRQYHAQFDSLMVSNDYNIDQVIEAWQAGV